MSVTPRFIAKDAFQTQPTRTSLNKYKSQTNVVSDLKVSKIKKVKKVEPLISDMHSKTYHARAIIDQRANGKPLCTSQSHLKLKVEFKPRELSRHLR